MCFVCYIELLFIDLVVLLLTNFFTAGFCEGVRQGLKNGKMWVTTSQERKRAKFFETPSKQENHLAVMEIDTFVRISFKTMKKRDRRVHLPKSRNNPSNQVVNYQHRNGGAIPLFPYHFESLIIPTLQRIRR